MKTLFERKMHRALHFLDEDSRKNTRGFTRGWSRAAVLLLFSAFLASSVWVSAALSGQAEYLPYVCVADPDDPALLTYVFLRHETSNELLPVYRPAQLPAGVTLRDESRLKDSFYALYQNRTGTRSFALSYCRVKEGTTVSLEPLGELTAEETWVLDGRAVLARSEGENDWTCSWLSEDGMLWFTLQAALSRDEVQRVIRSLKIVEE